MANADLPIPSILSDFSARFRLKPTSSPLEAPILRTANADLVSWVALGRSTSPQGALGSLSSPEGTEGDRLHTLIQESDISWSLVNDTLRENKDKYHQPRVYNLLQNARIIQHVLRSSIILKAGDHVNMTPLLSVVTHLIMSGKPFDEAQLILDYIHSLSDIRHPQTKRKKNIALGHLICYILEKKYNLIYPEPPTEESIFFTNASFRSLVHDPSVEGEDSEGEKEVPPEPAPIPNQNAYQDMIQRFDTMEINLVKGLIKLTFT
ncbi:hypothetical protein M5K25_018017 [Dendrobium thyrsiflorum]|uniref:CCR4-NOT transcription complex subunit 11 n=1 Tax=Dendrobium thyrsiflorum TaxID=117978 RepID=A0ABD0UP59_DENTH